MRELFRSYCKEYLEKLKVELSEEENWEVCRNDCLDEMIEKMKDEKWEKVEDMSDEEMYEVFSEEWEEFEK